MKKIFIALMAVTLFVGCAKESENVETPALKVVFSVADKVGLEADTKAIKNSWADGDQILLLFKPDNKTSLLPFENNLNSIKLTYNGGKWNASDFNGDVASLSTGGYFAGVYHYGEVSFGAADNNNKVFLENYIGGDYLECNGSYTISDGAIDLGTISMTRSAHAYMISVRNLASVDGPWTLTVGDNNNMSIMLYDVAFAEYSLFMYANDSAGGLRRIANYDTAGGVVNDTDISFRFEKGSDYKGNKYYFTISNGVDAYVLVKEEVTNETLQAGKAYYLPSIDSPRWTKK